MTWQTTGTTAGTALADDGPATRPPAELYAEVAQFYASHMFLLDSGEAHGWAQTFTADGVFAPPSAPEPVVGRAALAEGVRESAGQQRARGEQHRHLVLSLDVRPREDGQIDVRGYTQVVVTSAGGEPKLQLMCVMYDVLTREDGELLVRHRRVTRDDRP